jgi:hypothetical protein
MKQRKREKEIERRDRQSARLEPTFSLHQTSAAGSLDEKEARKFHHLLDKRPFFCQTKQFNFQLTLTFHAISVGCGRIKCCENLASGIEETPWLKTPVKNFHIVKYEVA